MPVTEHPDQMKAQLDLLLALDQARDRVNMAGDPSAMLRAIVELLQARFAADAAALLILDQTGHEPDAIITASITESTALELGQAALKLQAPGIIREKQREHVLGMRVFHEESNQVLGALILARAEPFSQPEADLIQIAETQIDSAILQARMVYELAQHNRQLETIYAIDRMRDDSTSESELINGFTSILVDEFDAELCVIILSHIDSGEMIVRGLVDKKNLPLQAIEAIRDMTGSMRIPQIIETPTEIGDMTLLAAPLNVSGTQFGSVVVGRKRRFTAVDQRLLFAMMSQMDSAIAHSRVSQQLNQRNQELETIYRIDVIRDEENDFDAMLQQVLTELCAAVSSEIGYLMLYSEQDERRLELKATTVEGLLTSPVYFDAITRMSRQALEQGEPVYSNNPNGAVRSIVAVPLILNEQIIGVFGTVNSSNARGFSAEDRRMLTAITSQVDTAVFERLERRRMRRVLGRSVDPKVLEHLLQRADDTVLTGERVILSVLFADMRGSTEWAERTDPEQLVQMLNLFLGHMTDVIFAYGGTLDKFVGDEVIALFGTPIHIADHAERAARCALELQKAHTALQAEMAAQGIELPDIGIGVATGEVIAGEIGPPIRTDFTAMGRTMNLGARLCSAAAPGQIIISAATCEILGNSFETQELEQTLKGIGNVRAFGLLGVHMD